MKTDAEVEAWLADSSEEYVLAWKPIITRYVNRLQAERDRLAAALRSLTDATWVEPSWRTARRRRTKGETHER